MYKESRVTSKSSGPAPCGPREGLLRFKARGRTRRPNLALFFVFILCCIFVLFDFVVLGLASSVLANRLAGKNVSEMTYFASSGT